MRGGQFMRQMILGCSLIALLIVTWAVARGDDKGSTKAKRPPAKKTTVSKVESAPAELEVVTNSLGMKFVKIPAGAFNMGSDQGFDDEVPVHRVTISKAFYLGVTEVTQGQYEELTGENPSQYVASPEHPVDS